MCSDQKWWSVDIWGEQQGSVWQRHRIHEPGRERWEDWQQKKFTEQHAVDCGLRVLILCHTKSDAFILAFGVENMATAMDEDLEDELEEKEEKSMMCQPGMHKWKLDQCMVCTVCGDCTGYGASCVSSGRPDRVPGG